MGRDGLPYWMVQKAPAPYRLTLSDPDGRRHLVFASKAHYLSLSDEARADAFAEVRRGRPGAVLMMLADPMSPELHPSRDAGRRLSRSAAYAQIYDPANLIPKGD